MPNETMKAAVATAYGDASVVAIAEMPIPEPGEGEIRIRVSATTVSSGDWRLRSAILPAGMGTLFRLAMGWNQLRKPVLGTELCGVVDALGPGVTHYALGDEVVAFPGESMGAHAEFVCMPEDGRVIPRPAELSTEEAAAMCFGGITAVHYLRDKAKVGPGARVLVIGPGGTVGSAGVQVALALGAEVHGLGSEHHREAAEALGVTGWHDSSKMSWQESDGPYDAIFDTVGATHYAECRPCLADGGVLLRAVASLPGLVAAPFQGHLRGHRVIAGVSAEAVESMVYLAELAEARLYRPAIDSTFAFPAFVDAHARIDQGHKAGSVVVMA